MTYRMMGAIALTAGLAFGGIALAQNDPGQHNDMAGHMNMNMGQNGAQQNGQSVDRQIRQQLDQFSKDPKTAGEKLFILEAAIHSRWAQRLSEHAQQNAQNDQVKQLARQIVNDHQRMNQQIEQTARQLDVELPQHLPELKQAELKLLTALPADQFQKQYVALMQADHAMAVRIFRAEAEMAQDQQVKQFASNCLPALRQHLEHSEKAAVALGLPSASEAQPAGARIPGENAQNQSQMHGQHQDQGSRLNHQMEGSHE